MPFERTRLIGLVIFHSPEKSRVAKFESNTTAKVPAATMRLPIPSIHAGQESNTAAAAISVA